MEIKSSDFNFDCLHFIQDKVYIKCFFSINNDLVI